MKKGSSKIINFIIAFCAFFITFNVKAVNEGYNPVEPTCIDKGECLLVCNYKQVTQVKNINNSGKKSSRNLSVYYYFDGDWEIKWYGLDNTEHVYSKKKNAFDKVFPDKILKTGVNADNFVCPKNGYIDINWFSGNNEICFDNDGSTCKNSSNVGTSFGKDSGSDAFVSTTNDYNFEADIDQYINSSSFTDITLQDIIDGKYTNDENLADNFEADFKTNYLSGHNPASFIRNTSSYQNFGVLFANKYQEHKELLKEEAEREFQNGNITQEERDKVVTTLDNMGDNLAEAVERRKQQMENNNGKVIYDSMNCSVLLGDPDDPNHESPAYWLQFCLNIIKYIGIVALLGLSTSDFFKALVQDDKDALKKATITTVKRFIFVVLLFFLPIIVEVLMKLVGAYGTCNIG